MTTRWFQLAVCVMAGVALGGCELRGEKQDKQLYGKASAKKAKPTANKPEPKPEPKAKPSKPEPKTTKPPQRPRPRRLTSVKPGDIKWEPYTVDKAGLTFDSFGKDTVREIKRNSFVATSQAPLNAFIFYSGKHTYDKEVKRYSGRQNIKLSDERKLTICGKPARQREINTGALTAVLAGWKHKGTEMLAVWRVPAALRDQYKAAEARFWKGIKCK